SLIALYLLVLFMVPLPPSFTLFPYTTLFRSREQLRHLADLLGRDAGDGSCPFRRLRLAVVLALHIGDPAVGAGGVALHVFAILRSEEHTSELQSRENLVCRLLLEKKKIIPNI